MEKIKGFKNSFVLYDLFGYLLPGFFFCCLFIVDHDFVTIIDYYKKNNSVVGLSRNNSGFFLDYVYRYLNWNSDETFKFTSVLLAIVFCYTLGHIIAAFSSLVLEKWVNKNLLGYPSTNLLSTQKRPWIKRCFNSYTKPFNTAFIEEFKCVFEKRFIKSNNQDFFWLCFTDVAKYLPSGFNRVIHFLNLYGFNRNISASFLLFIIVRILSVYILNIDFLHNEWVIFLIYSFAMFICFKNYLKLYQRLCSELFYHFYSLHTDPNYFSIKEENKSSD